MNRKYSPLIPISLLFTSFSLGIPSMTLANPARLPNNTLINSANGPTYQINCPQGSQHFINLAYSEFPSNEDAVKSNLRLASACIELFHEVEPSDSDELDFGNATVPEDANAEEEFDLAYAGRLNEFREDFENDQSLCWPDDIAVDDTADIKVVTCADLQPDESGSPTGNLLEELACLVLNCPD